MNKKRLLDDCYRTEGGKQIEKTKTKHIIEIIQNDTYERTPQHEILQCTKQETKTLIIARFGMLECGANFKGTLREFCDTCKQTDDESHRLNYCPKFKELNRYDSTDKVDFANIFSNDINTLKQIIYEIERVWNVKTAHGTMKK